MRGLDMLGAAENLASQAIVLRVRSIDTEKLKRGVGAGAWGGLLPGALAAVDTFPKLALDMALPFARKELAKLGVMADLDVAAVPPPPRAKSEALPALAIGLFFGIGLMLGGRFFYGRITPHVGVKAL